MALPAQSAASIFSRYWSDGGIFPRGVQKQFHVWASRDQPVENWYSYTALQTYGQLSRTCTICQSARLPSIQTNIYCECCAAVMYYSNMFLSCWIHLLSGKQLTVCIYTHCTHTSHTHLFPEVFFLIFFFLSSRTHRLTDSYNFSYFAERLRRGWLHGTNKKAHLERVVIRQHDKAAQTQSTKQSSKLLGVYPEALTELYTSVLLVQLSRPSVETHNACSIPRSIPHGVIKAKQSVWMFYVSISSAARAPGSFSPTHGGCFFCNLTNFFFCFYKSICALSYSPLLGQLLCHAATL